MIDDEIEREYKAAVDEYEKAQSAFARAEARRNRASRAMCEAFDRHMRESEARIAARKGSTYR